MNIDTFIARLEACKPSGADKWTARCPAHLDNSPSLSIHALSDGRILIHCFAGCEPGDVLAAIGLSFTDLFPEPIAHHKPGLRKRFSADDALLALNHEALVIAFLAESIAEGVTDPELCKRAQLAAERIRTAISICNG